ncbi:glycosyltransferase family 4 protein [Nocardiopsis sp. L17-MgMaSL7]|uniref:glycosyltransferase family 4 protein n=1 Tax=Nocardiopsis sp. L17-MgMaSL7 TaxID=1938893 RepID=UPI000D70C9C6|nr:glycosyltransferase family 4 protein [Nocardiopsis sp. L17-MgMaSL7]PWV54955.1 glycosyltransferase involved in cell wall biosynthesis [Nocardiopsis sp. L17-MgMaSL7]
MRIAFVIANGYAMGGTVRTVHNLARGLSAHHEVEIVSLVRKRRRPFFTPDENVRLVPLSDDTDESRVRPPRKRVMDHWHQQAERIVPEPERRRNKNYTPEAVTGLRRYLRTTKADVVIGTRPGINLLLAEWAPSRVLTIGQEHLNLGEHNAKVRKAITKVYPKLGGLSVLTETDRAAYAELLGSPEGWLTALPNALEPGEPPRATLDEPIIAAAGRFSPVKQYPLLVEAFAHVVAEHPEWRLHIHGGGDRDEELRETVRRLGLENNVGIMGRTTDMLGELSKASMLAVSSRVEGFGMTIIEAFSVGVPAVSFDCPHGPREIIDHGRNGLLVPPQDTEALGAALNRLVADREERHRMGAQALASASDYGLEDVTAQWEAFLEQRRERRPRRGPLAALFS